MGQKFAAYNASGAIVAFYDREDSPAPATASVIQITDSEWLACLSQPGWTVSKGALVAPAPAAAPTLADVQSAQNDVILAAAQSALAAVVAAYPDLEVATWPQQLAEATAYTASNTAATPMLSAIATTSGWTVANLAANVMQKAAAFQSASGAVVGKRIALMDQIAAATTVAAVQAVIW